MTGYKGLVFCPDKRLCYYPDIGLSIDNQDPHSPAASTTGTVTTEKWVWLSRKYFSIFGMAQYERVILLFYQVLSGLSLSQRAIRHLFISINKVFIFLSSLPQRSPVTSEHNPWPEPDLWPWPYLCRTRGQYRLHVGSSPGGQCFCLSPGCPDGGLQEVPLLQSQGSCCPWGPQCSAVALDPKWVK